MKKYLILLMYTFILLGSTSEAKSPFIAAPFQGKIFQSIEDGWYSATVHYSNYSTGTRATYTLEVKVVRNQVVAIQFGNGGSVHTGFNNSGYIYSGGYLRVEKNYNGDITAASTTVQISDSDGIKSFDIRIE